MLRRKDENCDHGNPKTLPDHRLGRASYVHRNTPGDIGIGCLHLQLAERLSSAGRSGKFRAQANSVNSGWQTISSKMYLLRRFRPGFGCGNVLTHCFCFRADARGSFRSQEIFFVVIENKIHFFLVDFATDF